MTTLGFFSVEMFSRHYSVRHYCIFFYIIKFDTLKYIKDIIKRLEIILYMCRKNLLILTQIIEILS